MPAPGRYSYLTRRYSYNKDEGDTVIARINRLLSFKDQITFSDRTMFETGATLGRGV